MVVQAILDAAREHLDSLDPPGLHAAVKLLRDTGRGPEASELLADFVRRRTGRMLAFAVDPTSDFAKDQIDPEVNAALAAMFTPPMDDRPAGEVFRTIASQGCWSDADIARLASHTPAQLEMIIEETEGDDLRSSCGSR